MVEPRAVVACTTCKREISGSSRRLSGVVLHVTARHFIHTPQRYFTGLVIDINDDTALQPKAKQRAKLFAATENKS